MPTVLLVLLVIFILIMVVLLVIQASLIIYSLKLGVPFVPSKNKVITTVMDNFNFSSGARFYDLGSGDGQAVYTLAIQYPKVQFIGYELNPILYFFSKFFCRRPNLAFHRKNFFQADLKNADYIYVFLYPELMKKLLPKLKSELRPGAVVFSNHFNFSEGIAPERVFSSSRPLETLYVYKF
jgi:SAM-dependent methyltransferase